MNSLAFHQGFVLLEVIGVRALGQIGPCGITGLPRRRKADRRVVADHQQFLFAKGAAPKPPRLCPRHFDQQGQPFKIGHLVGFVGGVQRPNLCIAKNASGGCVSFSLCHRTPEHTPNLGVGSRIRLDNVGSTLRPKSLIYKGFMGVTGRF